MLIQGLTQLVAAGHLQAGWRRGGCPTTTATAPPHDHRPSPGGWLPYYHCHCPTPRPPPFPGRVAASPAPGTRVSHGRPRPCPPLTAGQRAQAGYRVRSARVHGWRLLCWRLALQCFVWLRACRAAATHVKNVDERVPAAGRQQEAARLLQLLASCRGRGVVQGQHFRVVRLPAGRPRRGSRSHAAGWRRQQAVRGEAQAAQRHPGWGGGTASQWTQQLPAARVPDPEVPAPSASQQLPP